MLLLNKVRTASITLSSFLLLGASTCEKMPDNSPCLVMLADQTCAKYKLVDKQNMKYAFDSWQPITYIDGGFAFPKGELEKILDYIRNNRCDKAQKAIEQYSAGP